MQSTLMRFVGTLDTTLRNTLDAAGTTAGHGRLTVSQLRYLEAIDRLEHPTVSSVATCLGVSPASASTAIRNLEAGGHVTKATSETDHRVVVLSLTHLGLAPIRARAVAVAEYEAFIEGALTEEDHEALERIMAILIDRFEAVSA